MARDLRQLPWQQVSALSARLAALPIFEDPAPDTFDREVLNRFYTPAGGVTVTQQLLARYQTADQHVQMLPAAHQTALKARMNDLLVRVQAMDCKNCARQGSRHTCAGQDEDQDDAQLTNPGLCLSVLHDLFHDVLRRYVRTVRALAFEGDPSYGQDLEVLLSTRAKPESAYDRAGEEWKIGGYTRFLDGVSGRISEIKLSIGIDTLDWSSVCSTFWILVHELVCHAQQGRPGRDARNPCSQSCPFFEGWMDEIALRLLRADLDARAFGGGCCAFVTQHRQRLSQAAGDFRSSRYGWGPSAKRHKYAPQWDLGVKAVGAIDQFLTTFVPEGADPADADTLPKLVRLSFRLQQLAPDPTESVRLVNALLAAPSVVRRHSRWAQGDLFNILTSPIENTSTWINDLEGLTQLDDM